MRQKLNENSAAQAVLIGLLALAGGYLLLSSLSGGESAPEAESSAPTSSVSSPSETTVSESALPSEVGTAAVTSAPVPSNIPLPAAVEKAYARGATVVLLIVREGGIDDRLVKQATATVAGDSSVALFVVPAEHVSRYASITGPLGVESSPALIVIRPHRLNEGGPAPATVTYGFQEADDVEQAIRDAIYKGPPLTYTPN
jgi:hypothetical protein